MGNQSTSGIVEEVKAKNEASENVQEVSSPDEMKEENQALNQEDESKSFQENAAETDSHDAEAEKSEKVSEEHKRSVNEEFESQTNIRSNESNLEEGRSKFNSEEQDQPCTLQGEMQNPNPNFASTITNLSSTTHEAVEITSQLQEDQIMSQKEIVETRGLADSCQIETESCLVDVSDIDDRGVEKKDEMVVADTASVEGAISEMCAHEEELCRNDDPHREDQSNCLNALNDLPRISLPDLSAAEDEKRSEFSALDEDKIMMNELCDGDNASCLDQTQSPDQEINQFLISMIKSDFKENGEECEVEIDPLSDLEKDDPVDEDKAGEETEGSIAVREKQENDEPRDESIVEKVILRENEPSATENDNEIETETTEKCVIQQQSSMEIDIVTKFECAKNTQRLSITTAEAETPPTPVIEDDESKACESVEMLDFVSKRSNVGAQNELRKSPSFDFGLSFDKRSEESDQTPLLYQDRTPMRSFSSCSNLRFQSRSVQTEYIGKSIHYEAVEVEEKTIRMERSNSESLRIPPSKEGKSNVITKAKQENSASDKKQENGLDSSPSRNDGATISPRENAKRKPRSSLFTTCICCTAAIS